MTASHLAVSIGCPCGVGPEVSVDAAAGSRARVVLVGDWGVVLRAARLRRVAASRFVRLERAESARRLPPRAIGVLQPTAPLAPRDARPGAPSARSGAAQLAWIDAACDLVSSGVLDALVTGPVSKEAIVRSRAPGSRGFLGHTEHLQRRLRAREVVMAFWSAGFTTALATTHLALARVPKSVTSEAVSRATFWLGWLLARLHEREARIVVCGLNPHAGEKGLLGREEARRIAPGIAHARSRLRAARIAARVDGPVPAESAFRHAAAGRFDGVVAMYHDQATIPVKLLGFGDAVNLSLGLPIVRTSVDHGTAYDIAGRGVADASGMRAALELAARLSAPSSARARTRATPGGRRRSPRR